MKAARVDIVLVGLETLLLPVRRPSIWPPFVAVLTTGAAAPPAAGEAAAAASGSAEGRLSTPPDR